MKITTIKIDLAKAVFQVHDDVCKDLDGDLDERDHALIMP